MPRETSPNKTTINTNKKLEDIKYTVSGLITEFNIYDLKGIKLISVINLNQTYYQT